MSNSIASTLITRTLDNVSRSGTGVTRSGATLSSLGLSWLNDIQYDVSRGHDFRESKKRYTTSLVASSKTYAFPDNYKQIIDMVVVDGSNSRKLGLTIPQVFEVKVPYPENESQDIPYTYIPYGSNFDVFPIPSTAYTVTCRAVLWPTALTSTASTIFYTPDKDDMLIAGMTYKCFHHLQMAEDASTWKAEYRDLKKRAMLNDVDMPDWSPKGEGFYSGSGDLPLGNYWNNPFIRNVG